MNQPRFLRRKKARNLLWREANGKCRLCGRDLPSNWHADHIVAYSKGGKTNVHEMQALCPECDSKKGPR